MPDRLYELSAEIAYSPRVSWVEFAILRAYKQMYRQTPKPGWRRLERLAWAIRIKHGESRRKRRPNATRP